MKQKNESDDLDRAIAALTVQAVWRRVPGLPAVPREGNVLVKSPFREERNKSFSICFKGSGYKDHATGESGGVWKFAKQATGKEGKELADWLIEASVVARTPREKKELGAGSKEQDFKAARRAKPKPYPTRATKALMAVQHAKALGSQVEVKQVAAWPVMVERRWVQGSADTWGRVAGLAVSRGWPESWVLQLLEMDLLSYPLLPWYDTLRRREDETGPAFRVDRPVYPGSPLGEFAVRIEPVGYHQRFEIRGEKSWVYVPYLKPERECRSGFQRGLRAWALSRGAEDDGSALVPGLPFVLPGGAVCTHLVITEGQWDAGSFAGACGWLDSDTAWPEGWWVMGARGNNGADTLLAYWGPWLRHWKPRVLLLADNDKASVGWDNARMAGESVAWSGEWEPGVVPSFKEKLLALGCPVVQVRRVAAGLGKDFNDYWKARRPSPEAMARWLGGVFDTSKQSA